MVIGVHPGFVRKLGGADSAAVACAPQLPQFARIGQLFQVGYLPGSDTHPQSGNPGQKLLTAFSVL